MSAREKTRGLLNSPREETRGVQRRQRTEWKSISSPRKNATPPHCFQALSFYPRCSPVVYAIPSRCLVSPIFSTPCFSLFFGMSFFCFSFRPLIRIRRLAVIATPKRSIGVAHFQSHSFPPFFFVVFFSNRTFAFIIAVNIARIHEHTPRQLCHFAI